MFRRYPARRVAGQQVGERGGFDLRIDGLGHTSLFLHPHLDYRPFRLIVNAL